MAVEKGTVVRREYGSLPTKKKDTAEHDKSAVEKSNGITVDNKSILIQICLA